jgi:hypothetical protein
VHCPQAPSTAAALQDEVLLMRGAARRRRPEADSAAGLLQRPSPPTGYRPTSLEWDIW